MALPVGAEDRPVRVDHGEAVVIVRPVLLEERGRDRDLEAPGELTHSCDGGVLGKGPSLSEVRLVLVAAKVLALEELGREDHASTLRRRLFDQ
jgi:hypothetical protein